MTAAFNRVAIDSDMDGIGGADLLPGKARVGARWAGISAAIRRAQLDRRQGGVIRKTSGYHTAWCRMRAKGRLGGNRDDTADRPFEGVCHVHRRGIAGKRQQGSNQACGTDHQFLRHGGVLPGFETLVLKPRIAEHAGEMCNWMMCERLRFDRIEWCPQRDLNPCYCLERAMS